MRARKGVILVCACDGEIDGWDECMYGRKESGIKDGLDPVGTNSSFYLVFIPRLRRPGVIGEVSGRVHAVR